MCWFPNGAPPGVGAVISWPYGPPRESGMLGVKAGHTRPLAEVELACVMPGCGSSHRLCQVAVRPLWKVTSSHRPPWPLRFDCTSSALRKDRSVNAPASPHCSAMAR